MTNSAGVLSPTELKWHPKVEPHGLGIDHAMPMHPTNPFHMSEPFGRQSGISSLTYPSASWPFEQQSENHTPTSFELYSPAGDIDAPHFQSAGMEPSQAGFPSFTHAHPESGYLSSTQVKSPMSPESSTDWMAMAEQDVHGKPHPRRMRPSNAIRSASDFAKPDGIRKKNTRIEIPLERSLPTIEKLIDQTNDEDEIKELKAQRRLLRNREAAYV